MGEWRTTAPHPYVLGATFHGRTLFALHEGGAFLIMHSEIDEREIPSAVAILGSDDATQKYFMVYFDERGVSRKYDVSITRNRLAWWRDDPKFSQRFIITIADDGTRMIGEGEMARDGAAWEKDLSLTYTRE